MLKRAVLAWTEKESHELQSWEDVRWYSINLLGVAAIVAFLLFASGMKRRVKHFFVNLTVHEEF